MRPITAILAVLTGLAGWFYLFYSKSAAGLGSVEQRQPNLRRVRLRRANGFVMILLAVLLYVGTYATDERTHPALFLTAWMAVSLLLGMVVLLVLADVRLTMRLRERLGSAPGPGGRRRPAGEPGRPAPSAGPGRAADAKDADGPGGANNPRTPP